ncbi:hypothetical protein FKP32DRAFT_1013823 [Trametes sanguinea]|nr:hypothetical protein FKP32DRAFT_1013823 [Trametes sanguinea]
MRMSFPMRLRRFCQKAAGIDRGMQPSFGLQVGLSDVRCDLRPLSPRRAAEQGMRNSRAGSRECRQGCSPSEPHLRRAGTRGGRYSLKYPTFRRSGCAASHGCFFACISTTRCFSAPVCVRLHHYHTHNGCWRRIRHDAVLGRRVSRRRCCGISFDRWRTSRGEGAASSAALPRRRRGGRFPWVAYSDDRPWQLLSFAASRSRPPQWKRWKTVLPGFESQ